MAGPALCNPSKFSRTLWDYVGGGIIGQDVEIVPEVQVGLHDLLQAALACVIGPTEHAPSGIATVPSESEISAAQEKQVRKQKELLICRIQVMFQLNGLLVRSLPFLMLTVGERETPLYEPRYITKARVRLMVGALNRLFGETYTAGSLFTEVSSRDGRAEGVRRVVSTSLMVGTCSILKV